MKKATAAVIMDQDKILIAQRSKDDFWEFPGGKIDNGETPAECIVREIKEELNLDIKVRGFLGMIEGVYRGAPMQVYAFLADLASGQMMLNVHKDVKWLDRKDIESSSLVEEDRVILERFLPS